MATQSSLNLREKLIKFGTWIFLALLFVIIVLSFGMPDFIGTSSRMDSYNAAKIGGEYLTRAEVAESQKQIEERMAQNMKGLDAKNRKILEDMAKGRALDESIDRKIFTQVLKEEGYIPSASSEARILATFYKRQFGEYIINGKLDIERLNEVLGKRRLSLDQIGRTILLDYGPQKAFEMLQATAYASPYTLIDAARFATTRNSLRVVVLDSATKDKLMRARFNPSEAEIQAKFKTEFLARDAKAVLDKVKRDSIRATLFNENRANLEKDLTTYLQNTASKGIDAIAAATGASPLLLTDVGLSDDLDAKKPKGLSTSLSPLSQSEVFVKQRLGAPIGHLIGPVDAGGLTYFFTITARKEANLPAATEYKKIENAKEILTKAKDLPKGMTYDTLFESAARGNYGELLTAAVEMQRNSVRIIRYNTAN
ncbi:MAG TPA: SurA N-terminal domain-containing protein [Turneriella sp.]|nr:SurA N-terminal domain-containing protein [Turneriella sp.]